MTLLSHRLYVLIQTKWAKLPKKAVCRSVFLTIWHCEARPMADEGHPKLDVLLASLHRDHADVLPGV